MHLARRVQFALVALTALVGGLNRLEQKPSRANRNRIGFLYGRTPKVRAAAKVRDAEYDEAFRDKVRAQISPLADRRFYIDSLTAAHDQSKRDRRRKPKPEVVRAMRTIGLPA